MPTRIAHAPRAVPLQDMFSLGLFPQREVFRVMFPFAYQVASPGFLFPDSTIGELAVFGPACHVEVHAAIRNVGVALVNELLDHLNLFRDVGAGTRANIRAHNVECVHILEVAAGVGFDNLHGQCRCLPRFLENAVFPGVEQMAHIGQVLYIQYIVAAVAQPADDHVKRDIGLGMAQVRIVIDSWAADIHIDFAGRDRHEVNLLALKDVKNTERHGYATSSI